MKNSHGRIAAIYARVSSEQQAEAATIASQVAALEERVAKDGLVLEPQMRFLDEGYSGATLIRPALERLRDMAVTGAMDRLYVHNPDRLARKYAYQVLLLDELSRCGVEVVFLNHRLGETPEEDLLLQVQGMVAEYERAKILERSRRGKLHAARQGSVTHVNRTLRGWFEYFKHSYLTVFRDLDAWVRGRLRNILRRRQHRRGRASGADHHRWPNAYFAEQGLYSLVLAHAQACQSSRR